MNKTRFHTGNGIKPRPMAGINPGSLTDIVEGIKANRQAYLDSFTEKGDEYGETLQHETSEGDNEQGQS